jgi:3-oxoadipate enol-lactonase
MTHRDLHHEIDGRPGGPTLLLLHPLGGSLRFWDRCRACWSGHRHLVAYDRPGAGKTPAPPAPQTLAESVEDLDRLCERLELDFVVPVGVAIGAMIGAAYAARHGKRVTGLVLCNPATGLSPAGRDLTMTRLQVLREGGIAALLPAIVDRAFNGLPQDDSYHQYVDAFRSNDPIGFERNARGALDIDVTADLGQVHCPTLVLAGQHDVLFPPSEAQKVAALVRGATYQELPDAAHFPPFQTPVAFTAAVDAFLERL